MDSSLPTVADREVVEHGHIAHVVRARNGGPIGSGDPCLQFFRIVVNIVLPAHCAAVCLLIRPAARRDRRGSNRLGRKQCSVGRAAQSNVVLVVFMCMLVIVLIVMTMVMMLLLVLMGRRCLLVELLLKVTNNAKDFVEIRYLAEEHLLLHIPVIGRPRYAVRGDAEPE